MGQDKSPGKASMSVDPMGQDKSPGKASMSAGGRWAKVHTRRGTDNSTVGLSLLLANPNPLRFGFNHFYPEINPFVSK